MDIRITLKFLKSTPSSEPAVRLSPSMHVFEVVDHDYSSNNATETIICLVVPFNTTQDITFELVTPVRRVVLGSSDVPFKATNNQLALQLPPLIANNDRVADMHMIVPFPGVDLRLEVADANQRGGEYAKKPYPFDARTAAMAVEFALLEAIQALELDQNIGLGSCGPIYLMGFDTNNPCGHTDWPPHVHLHMARPAYGAPIGHYYFDSNFTFSHNIMYSRKVNAEVTQFERGVPCPHYAPDGSMLFDLTITKTGSLRLSAANGNSALIEPIDSGFNTGAYVSVDNRVMEIAVTLNDKPASVQVARDGVPTHYLFDPDTGAYLGPAQIADPPDELALNQPTHSQSAHKLNSDT